MGEHLTPAQGRAIEALLTCASVTQATEQAGVSRKTVYAWMRGNPAFVQQLRAAESEAMAAISRRLVGMAEAAAKALEEALKPEQPIMIRVKAAESVFGHMLRIRELADIEQRLSELEQKYEGGADYGKG